MSKLISGKEALEKYNDSQMCCESDKPVWIDLSKSKYSIEQILSEKESFSTCYIKLFFRLKPKTITINGIEVPAPFKPKAGEKVWFLNDDCKCGYGYSEDYDEDAHSIFGWWRT